MKYVTDYCIASLFYLLITFYYFTKQNKVPSIRTKLYASLIIFCLIALVFDYLAAEADAYATNIPSYVLYLLNIFLFIGTQSSGPIFFFYTTVLTGFYLKLNNFVKIILFLPYLVCIAFVLISPFSKSGIFYLDENHIYQYGSTHIFSYVAVAFYLLLSIIVILASPKTIQKRKKTTIFVFIGITFVAMLIQMLLKTYLVNTTAYAVALTIMYHSLQSPSDYTDPLTGVYNKETMNIFLRDLYEQKQTFSILVFSLKSFGLINYALGVRTSDLLLQSFSEFLRKKFSNQNVVRYTGITFIVIDTVHEDPYTKEELVKIHESIPERWIVGNSDTQLKTEISCVNSGICKTRTEMLNLIEYISQEKNESSFYTNLIIDKTYKKRLERKAIISNALDFAISNNGLVIHYQPIHDSDGKLVACEALCRINYGLNEIIGPDSFIKTAEQNGSIYQIGEQVLRKVCMFIKKYNVENWKLNHISINLSPVQCMQPDFADKITRIVDQYNIRKGFLSFEITETESVYEIPTVKENMQKLVDYGFTFLLDDFGSGYSNFNYISSLLFSCVKIDKVLLWKAMENPKQLSLLKGLGSVLKKMNLESLCEGIETKEQSELIKKLGFSMQQGFYFAKGLSEKEFINYAIKNGVNS